MRIGVLGDTHIPDLSPLLPARIKEVFKGLDIILHVGDICELDVLEELQEMYTLTFAVWGENDNDKVRRYLDEMRVVRFGARRLGMIHGHQFMNKKKGGLFRRRGRKSSARSLPEFLVEQFKGEQVDALIFGHTHEPYMETHQGVLLFSPGAAVPTSEHRPSVGILDVKDDSVTGKIVHL
jgi:putative phosphoesterase